MNEAGSVGQINLICRQFHRCRRSRCDVAQDRFGSVSALRKSWIICDSGQLVGCAFCINTERPQSMPRATRSEDRARNAEGPRGLHPDQNWVYASKQASLPGRRDLVNQAFDKVRNCISSDMLNRQGRRSPLIPLARIVREYFHPLTQPLPPVLRLRSGPEAHNDRTNGNREQQQAQVNASHSHGPTMMPPIARQASPKAQNAKRTASPRYSRLAIGVTLVAQTASLLYRRLPTGSVPANTHDTTNTERHNPVGVDENSRTIPRGNQNNRYTVRFANAPLSQPWASLRNSVGIEEYQERRDQSLLTSAATIIESAVPTAPLVIGHSRSSGFAKS